MDAAHQLLDFLKNLLEQLPSLLTILVCIVVALFKLKSLPKVSGIVIAGLVLLLLQALIFAAVYAWVPDRLLAASISGNRETSLRNIYFTLGVINNLLLAVSFALLLLGVFIQRPLKKTA